MFKKQIFEPIVAYEYVIEFKKWGLQHAHFLIILKTNAKLIAPESFDRVACVELPNKNHTWKLIFSSHKTYVTWSMWLSKLKQCMYEKKRVNVEMTTINLFVLKLFKEKIPIQNIDDVMMVKK